MTQRTPSRSRTPPQSKATPTYNLRNRTPEVTRNREAEGQSTSPPPSTPRTPARRRRGRGAARQSEVRAGSQLPPVTPRRNTPDPSVTDSVSRATNSEHPLTLRNLSIWRKVDLIAECRKRSLSYRGSKRDLRARILEDIPPEERPTQLLADDSGNRIIRTRATTAAESPARPLDVVQTRGAANSVTPASGTSDTPVETVPFAGRPLRSSSGIDRINSARSATGVHHDFVERRLTAEVSECARGGASDAHMADSRADSLRENTVSELPSLQDARVLPVVADPPAGGTEDVHSALEYMPAERAGNDASKHARFAGRRLSDLQKGVVPVVSGFLKLPAGSFPRSSGEISHGGSAEQSGLASEGEDVGSHSVETGAEVDGETVLKEPGGSALQSGVDVELADSQKNDLGAFDEAKTRGRSGDESKNCDDLIDETEESARPGDDTEIAPSGDVDMTAPDLAQASTHTPRSPEVEEEREERRVKVAVPDTDRTGSELEGGGKFGGDAGLNSVSSGLEADERMVESTDVIDRHQITKEPEETHSPPADSATVSDAVNGVHEGDRGEVSADNAVASPVGDREEHLPDEDKADSSGDRVLITQRSDDRSLSLSDSRADGPEDRLPEVDRAVSSGSPVPITQRSDALSLSVSDSRVDDREVRLPEVDSVVSSGSHVRGVTPQSPVRSAQLGDGNAVDEMVATSGDADIEDARIGDDSAERSAVIDESANDKCLSESPSGKDRNSQGDRDDMSNERGDDMEITPEEVRPLDRKKNFGADIIPSSEGSRPAIDSINIDADARSPARRTDGRTSQTQKGDYSAMGEEISDGSSKPQYPEYKEAEEPREPVIYDYEEMGSREPSPEFREGQEPKTPPPASEYLTEEAHDANAVASSPDNGEDDAMEIVERDLRDHLDEDVSPVSDGAKAGSSEGVESDMNGSGRPGIGSSDMSARLASEGGSDNAPRTLHLLRTQENHQRHVGTWADDGQASASDADKPPSQYESSYRQGSADSSAEQGKRLPSPSVDRSDASRSGIANSSVKQRKPLMSSSLDASVASRQDTGDSSVERGKRLASPSVDRFVDKQASSRDSSENRDEEMEDVIVPMHTGANEDFESDDPGLDSHRMEENVPVDSKTPEAAPGSQPIEQLEAVTRRKLFDLVYEEEYFSESPLPSPRAGASSIDDSKGSADMILDANLPNASRRDRSPERSDTPERPKVPESPVLLESPEASDVPIPPRSPVRASTDDSRSRGESAPLAERYEDSGSEDRNSRPIELHQREEQEESDLEDPRVSRHENLDIDTRGSADDGLVTMSQADEDLDENASVREDDERSLELDQVEVEEGEEDEVYELEDQLEEGQEEEDAESYDEVGVNAEMENNASSRSDQQYEEDNDGDWIIARDIPSDGGGEQIDRRGGRREEQSEESKSSDGSRSNGRSPHRSRVDTADSDDFISDYAGEEDVEEEESEEAIDGNIIEAHPDDVEVISLSSVGSDVAGPEGSDLEEGHDNTADVDHSDVRRNLEEEEVEAVDDERSIPVMEGEYGDGTHQIEEVDEREEVVSQRPLPPPGSDARDEADIAPQTNQRQDSRSGIIPVPGKGGWNVTGEGETSRPVPSPEASQMVDLLGNMLYSPRARSAGVSDKPSAILQQTRSNLVGLADSNAGAGTSRAEAAPPSGKGPNIGLSVDVGRSWSQSSAPHENMFAPPPSPFVTTGAIDNDMAAAPEAAPPDVFGSAAVDGSVRSAEVVSRPVEQAPFIAGNVGVSTDAIGLLLTTGKRERADDSGSVHGDTAVEPAAKRVKRGSGGATAKFRAMRTPMDSVMALRPMLPAAPADVSSAAKQSILDRLARIESKEKCPQFDAFRELPVGGVVAPESRTTPSGGGGVKEVRAFHQGVTGAQSRVGVLRSSGVRGITRSRLKVVNVSRFARAKALEQESVRKVNEIRQQLQSGRSVPPPDRDSSKRIGGRFAQ